MNRLARAVAGALAAAAMSIGLSATPALATTTDLTCASNSICLYANLNFGYAKWQSSIVNGYTAPNHCINLNSPAAYWPNGTQVWDNSASLKITGTDLWDGFYIELINSANCNTATGVAGFNGAWYTAYSNLNSVPMTAGVTAYHTIASIYVNDVSVP